MKACYANENAILLLRSAPAYDEEPTLLAVDCEMCATAHDDKALLSLCLVDVDGSILQQVHHAPRPYILCVHAVGGLMSRNCNGSLC